MSFNDKKTGTVGKLLEEPDAGPLTVFVSDKKGLPVLGALVTFKVTAGGGKIECLDEQGPKNEPAETCMVESNMRGLAKIRITLGKKTADNPVYQLLEGDKNHTQIGLNLVTASVKNYAGEIPLVQPFEAYGKPGVPKKIKKVYPIITDYSKPDDVTGVVNTPAGSLAVLVHDDVKNDPDDPNEDGNPVSNVKLVYEVSKIEVREPGFAVPVSNPGFRTLMFYKHDQCRKNAPFYEEECAKYLKPMIEDLITAYTGTHVNAMLGNTMNTRYTVKVSAPQFPGIAPAEFKVSTEQYRENGWYMPATLYIGYLYPANDKGMSLNASQAGTALKAPLTAGLFLIEEEKAPLEYVPDKGWRILPTGITRIRNIENGNVTFKTTQGGGSAALTNNLKDGRYEARYILGEEPAVNIIEATGSAEIKVPMIEVAYCDYANGTRTSICGKTEYYNLPELVPQPDVIYTTEQMPTMTKTLATGQAVLNDGYDIKDPNPFVYDTDLKPGYPNAFKKIEYTVYGVDVSLEVKPSLVLLNDEGYTTMDTDLKYTIRPSEYRALTATVDFFKNSTWTHYLVNDGLQGQGLMRMIPGSVFDSSALHEAQVVLNRGTGPGDKEQDGSNREQERDLREGRGLLRQSGNTHSAI